MKENKTTYIAMLPLEKRNDIFRALVKAGITGEDLDNAMDSRLCDLEDTIDLKKVFGRVEK